MEVFRTLDVYKRQEVERKTSEELRRELDELLKQEREMMDFQLAKKRADHPSLDWWLEPAREEKMCIRDSFECGALLLYNSQVIALRDDVLRTLPECREVQLADCRTSLAGTLLDSVLRLLSPLM